jgi:hypothetical protein
VDSLGLAAAGNPNDLSTDIVQIVLRGVEETRSNCPLGEHISREHKAADVPPDLICFAHFSYPPTASLHQKELSDRHF